MSDNVDVGAGIAAFFLVLAVIAALSFGWYAKGRQDGYDTATKQFWTQAIDLGIAEAVADVENDKITFQFKVEK